MSKRLEILQNSLAKKQAAFNTKLENHIEDVKSANGQPLNDKRNGHVTLNRWERQNESLRSTQKSIEKTQDAIQAEQWKIDGVNRAKETFPDCILKLIESGDLIQWRKYPRILFVNGVDKARIIWDNDTKIIAHKFTSQITDKDQWKKFAQTFNSIRAALIESAAK